MRIKRIAASFEITSEDSPEGADGQDSAANGSGEEDSGGHRPRRTHHEIAAEVAEAVIWNYQGKDPEIALAGLAELLEEKGQGDSDLAELIDELRLLLRRRLPPGRAVT